MSQVRSGLKIKSEGARRDWLRSMQMLLPIAEREIFDNEPALPLDEQAQEQQEQAASAAADQADEMAEEHGVGSGEEPDQQLDEGLAQDTAEFETAVGNVQEVDFGGEAVQ